MCCPFAGPGHSSPRIVRCLFVLAIQALRALYCITLALRVPSLLCSSLLARTRSVYAFGLQLRARFQRRIVSANYFTFHALQVVTSAELSARSHVSGLVDGEADAVHCAVSFRIAQGTAYAAVKLKYMPSRRCGCMTLYQLDV